MIGILKGEQKNPFTDLTDDESSLSRFAKEMG